MLWEPWLKQTVMFPRESSAIAVVRCITHTSVSLSVLCSYLNAAEGARANFPRRPIWELAADSLCFSCGLGSMGFHCWCFNSWKFDCSLFSCCVQLCTAILSTYSTFNPPASSQVLGSFGYRDVRYISSGTCAKKS